jgi:hypothetical protein
MPQPGGRLVNVAEAGKPEVVIPLDKLAELLAKTKTDTINQMSNISTVNIDKTRNETLNRFSNDKYDMKKSESVTNMTKILNFPTPLAEGGIVMPRQGGTLANVAEAGVPEIVGPLDKVESLLRSAGGGMDNTPIHLVVKLDSKPFLDKIFPATKNRTVLISAASVV